MKTIRKSMLLLGLALLTAVIQGSVFVPEVEAQELNPAHFNTELTAIPDLLDLGLPDVSHLASSPDPNSRGDGSVTTGPPEEVGSDEEGAQMEVYYERVTTFGRCWWFCTRIPTFCRCVVIYF